MEHSTEVEEGKTTAIISYIFYIGLIIAFVMNKDKKNSFASFHIRQMVGLSLLSLVNGFVLSRFTGAFFGSAIGTALFIFWILGLIGAVQGKEKKIPFLGDYFQDWFKKIG